MVMSSKREDSWNKNEKRRALAHDRLISHLLEVLLRLDSIIFISPKPTALRKQHLSRLWQALLSTPIFPNPLVPWRYRLAVLSYLVWPKTSMEVVSSSTSLLLPPLIFLLKSHFPVSEILQCHYLHWSLELILHPESPLPALSFRGSSVPVFGEKQVKLVKKCVHSNLSQPSDFLTGIFYHLISEAPIEPPSLREMVDYVLVDVGQRYGLTNVIFALLNKIPLSDFPPNLSELIYRLVSPKSKELNPVDGRIPTNTDSLSMEIEDNTANVPDRSFDVEILAPFNLFSHPEISPILLTCLQEILRETAWRSARDTKWLTAFIKHLKKANFPSIGCEGVIGILCCLIDALKDAMKTQLILKRWYLFLTVVAGLNSFGELLCDCLTADANNEIQEQLGKQVVKLAETAWAAGGARWPNFEEGYLPPVLSSLFCDSIHVWSRVSLPTE